MEQQRGVRRIKSRFTHQPGLTAQQAQSRFAGAQPGQTSQLGILQAGQLRPAVNGVLLEALLLAGEVGRQVPAVGLLLGVQDLGASRIVTEPLRRSRSASARTTG